MFAGPNGSGKSTFYKEISKRFRCGIYINPDEIERNLKLNHFLNFSEYSLDVSPPNFKNYILKSTWIFHLKKRKISIDDYLAIWQIRKNRISKIKNDIDSYDAALIADFLRHGLLKSGKTFTFETVMSHISKLELIKSAIEKGYKIYLYYVATDDPLINLNRIENRVLKGEHNVPVKKIMGRYKKSLQLMYDAIKLCDRSYIFDNTGLPPIL